MQVRKTERKIRPGPAPPPIAPAPATPAPQRAQIAQPAPPPAQVQEMAFVSLDKLMYRVIIQVDSNLPLTPKPELHFSTRGPRLKWNGTFVLLSTVGLNQSDVSPCKCLQVDLRSII